MMEKAEELYENATAAYFMIYINAINIHIYKWKLETYLLEKKTNIVIVIWFNLDRHIHNTFSPVLLESCLLSYSLTKTSYDSLNR